MKMQGSFSSFLTEIRPTRSQIDDYKTGHRVLRERLSSYDDLKAVVLATFLQGSYRRCTAVRPVGDKRADVDIVVVTNIDAGGCTPDDAIGMFVPFVDKYYEGKHSLAGRSIQIELGYVDLDLVVTAAPQNVDSAGYALLGKAMDECWDDPEVWEQSYVTDSPLSEMLRTAGLAEDWRPQPLLIPNRDAGDWTPTHPLEQIRWTVAKNAACNGHYINCVKALKWWRRVNHPEPAYPKGYPLEHMIGDACPDAVGSVAESVTLTLEAIAAAYASDVPGGVPYLPDRGVPEHNVLARITPEEFAAFHGQVAEAAEIAREALDSDDVAVSASLWRSLFGSKFPEQPQTSKSSAADHCCGQYTHRRAVSEVDGGRFA